MNKSPFVDEDNHVNTLGNVNKTLELLRFMDYEKLTDHALMAHRLLLVGMKDAVGHVASSLLSAEFRSGFHDRAERTADHD